MAPSPAGPDAARWQRRATILVGALVLLELLWELLLAPLRPGGSWLALKVLPLELTGDRDRRARMLREVRAAAQVMHPHVATVHEVGETEHGLVWIAMELDGAASKRGRIQPRAPVEAGARAKIAILRIRPQL